MTSSYEQVAKLHAKIATTEDTEERSGELNSATYSSSNGWLFKHFAAFPEPPKARISPTSRAVVIMRTRLSVIVALYSAGVDQPLGARKAMYQKVFSSTGAKLKLIKRDNGTEHAGQTDERWPKDERLIK